MRKILFVGSLAVALASCSASRKLVTTSSLDSTVTTNTAKSTATVVKEKADTTVAVKGDTAKASKPLDNFIAGDTLEANNNGTRLKVWYDPVANQVRGQAITDDKAVHLVVDRETTSNTNEASQTEATVSKMDKVVDKKVEAPPWYYSPWPWLTLLVLIIAAYLLWRYFPNMK